MGGFREIETIGSFPLGHRVQCSNAAFELHSLAAQMTGCVVEVIALPGERFLNERGAFEPVAEANVAIAVHNRDRGDFDLSGHFKAYADLVSERGLTRA